MRKDEKGYIVVETVCAFIPFVFLVISILSLVNIVTLQARVHNALTQAAKTLSVYSYLLEVTGVANDLTALAHKADNTARGVGELREDLSAALSGIDTLAGVRQTMDRVHGSGEAALSDPQAVISALLSFSQNELRNQVFELMVRPLVGRYLMNGNMTGDEYLQSVRVVNRHTGATGLDALEFYRFNNLGLGNSVLIDKDGNVKLTVEYEVEYTFGALPLPFRPTLRITQTAVTKAWLNGSGRGYW
ncbi:MAG: hypothetical protein FWC75_02615 [Oscillospiraceae bacterium]|nr:hypothetical protein [Oscillospiraceae bacterium]